MKIKIGDRYVGDREPTFIIAEVGSNYGKDLERAKKFVDLVKETGADAVKFQSFKAEKIIAKESFQERVSFQSKWKKPVYDTYIDAEFPREWHREIADYCRKRGIIFFSTPCDEEAVDLLDEIAPVFKINSGDITYLPFLEYVAKKGKPIILSTGASTMGEIEEAVNTIRLAGNEQIILLQCITNYPSPVEQANIRAMLTIKRAFQLPTGYSDHAPGWVVPLGAVALGACAIEKHFIDIKDYKGPDTETSLDFMDFSAMVRDIRALEKALGNFEKRVEPTEEMPRILQRRSIYTARDIPKGTTLSAEDIAYLRPAKGLHPKYGELLIGRKSTRDIKKGTPVRWEDMK